MNLPQPKNISLTLFFTTSLFLTFITTNVQAVDGVCGSANGQKFSTAPTNNLCSDGNPSQVLGTGPWNWTCTKSDPACNGGETKDCTTTDNCAGKQTCTTSGTWGACVKNNPNCGSNDYCYNGQWCDGDTGSCVNKCSECSCPLDKPNCNADGSCSNTSKDCDANYHRLLDGTCIPKWCSDETLLNQCSDKSIGKQCIGKQDGSGNIIGFELADACPTCPCPGGKSCQNGTCAPNDLPESFSWANKDGVNWLSPGQNQGGCGSCYIFAAVAAIEAMYNIEHGPGTAPDLSRQYALSCFNVGGCGGGYSSEVLFNIMNSGIHEESCMPYKGDDDLPCVTTCTTPKHGFSSFAPSAESIYHQIYRYGPAPISINEVHEVLMIGWESNGYIIYKNSNGTDVYQTITPNAVLLRSGTPTGTY